MTGCCNDRALQVAARHGRLAVVDRLIQSGADIRARDDLALRWAAYGGHAEVVDTLIKEGADVHAEDDQALRWAARHGHAAVVERGSLMPVPMFVPKATWRYGWQPVTATPMLSTN